MTLADEVLLATQKAEDESRRIEEQRAKQTRSLEAEAAVRQLPRNKTEIERRIRETASSGHWKFDMFLPGRSPYLNAAPIKEWLLQEGFSDVYVNSESTHVGMNTEGYGGHAEYGLRVKASWN